MCRLQNNKFVTHTSKIVLKMMQHRLELKAETLLTFCSYLSTKQSKNHKSQITN